MSRRIRNHLICGFGFAEASPLPLPLPWLSCLATGSVKSPPLHSLLLIYSNARELLLPSRVPQSRSGVWRRDGRVCLHLQGNLLIKETKGTALFLAAGTDGWITQCN